MRSFAAPVVEATKQLTEKERERDMFSLAHECQCQFYQNRLKDPYANSVSVIIGEDHDQHREGGSHTIFSFDHEEKKNQSKKKKGRGEGYLCRTILGTDEVKDGLLKTKDTLRGILC